LKLDIKSARNHLQTLDYNTLFIEDLGWNRPSLQIPITAVIHNTTYTLREIAELAGVAIFEVDTSALDGKIPDAATRKAIQKEISRSYHENLLIFLDTDNTQSLWYWVKRDGTKQYPCDHLYIKGQPGDLSLGKLEAMVFDIGDFAETGKIPVLEVASRLKEALDVERVTKRFYEDYKEEHLRFLDDIEGIDDERDLHWYASVLLNRLMFIYFLQRKWFIDNGNPNYLQDKLVESRERGPDRYYSEFLNLLFFEGFAKPENERGEAARQLLGTVVYLNGGLFLMHPIEKRWPSIRIPDGAFENLLSLFARYSWNLDDASGGDDNEISPHILGYIFEKYINQKSFGAYYTRPEITEYLCDRTIHKLILEKINSSPIPGRAQGRHFDTVEELLMNLNARICRDLLQELPKISLLDPACGSGAFLVSALNTLTKVYTAITGKIEYLTDNYLTNWLKQAHAEHDSLSYYIKKKIITENLFGVDIMEEGTEIAKLRLFLALVSSVQTVEQLEPLPNIDFNILPGNSLIGLLHVNESRLTQLNLVQKSYHEVVEEKNRLIRNYKNTAKYTKDLRALRDNIQAQRDEANANLNELLLDDFIQLGIKYEQATWDSLKDTDGKPNKRPLTIDDIASLHPFHWGYEFDQVMNERGGFDIIITNPPWEILKPQAKEFFETHSKLVSKNKMRIEDFETEKARLLQDADIRSAWLKYQSGFPLQSAYFRAAQQYENQISTVNGKKQGTDINLYKLFTEQCYNLLREGGECGIVIPSGIYTDLGAKQLREMLFNQTQVTGLFCFENNKAIFENVHRSYKIVVLTYEKGGQTQTFPTAFMRHEVKELERFPRVGALDMSVELVRRLSPDSLSVMEFKSKVDIGIAQKMLKFPLLGDKLADTWNVVLANEFHMTNDSSLFRTEPGPGRLPLYEGKMIHQFTHQWSKPRYWVDEKEGRSAILGRKADRGQKLDYQSYRLGYRAIGRTTDQRALIVTVFPFKSFAGNSLIISRRFSLENGNAIIDDRQTLFLTSILNSFIADYFIGQKISANLNMFYIYQLPVPRLTEQDIFFRMIVERAAKLICTTSEFQELWESVMPDTGWSTSVAALDSSVRAKLRAELDGIIAHLYGLSEEEFSHILDTFPLVEQQIKDAALDAYHKFDLEPDDLTLAELISKGENAQVEFKVTACWNLQPGKKGDSPIDNIIQEVAAFLNSREGGVVLIGVEDDGTIVGLKDDFKAANQQKQNRDGYQLFLLDNLKNNLVSNCSLFYKISFGKLQEKDVCRIDAAPSIEPVFIKGGDFYIREGNRKRKLSPQETVTYFKQRFV
jgi:hypothetical protein